MRDWLAFCREEDGLAVIEVVLLIVVAIALVIIFKEQLVSLVRDILNKITTQSNSI